MREQEPRKETIGRGELFFLAHPGREHTFSGYGLTVRPDSTEFLVGLLMIDRPQPADPTWLQRVGETFGDYQLTPMTATGERGIVCQMQVEPDSQRLLRQYPMDKAAAIQQALEPLLEQAPQPSFRLWWDEEHRLWRSEFAIHSELPAELREVFESTGYGCLAAETNIGVVHVCHASDADIEGFADKPVWHQWQLIKMPTAPLIRLEVVILDDPQHPFKFESFLNVAAADQARILAQLAGQEQLHLAFYGDDLSYQYTKKIPHDEQQWQQLDELTQEAERYWEQLPHWRRDFDLAKAHFMSRFI